MQNHFYRLQMNYNFAELTKVNRMSLEKLEEIVNITAVYFKQVIASIQIIEKIPKSIDLTSLLFKIAYILQC